MNLIEAYKELNTAYNECLEKGWDGYGADPVRSESYRWAVNYIRELPEWVPMPDFGVDPDGSVSMMWYYGKRAQIWLSFYAEDYIAYGALTNDKRHGIVKTSEDREFILETIKYISGKL